MKRCPKSTKAKYKTVMRTGTSMEHFSNGEEEAPGEESVSLQIHRKTATCKRTTARGFQRLTEICHCSSMAEAPFLHSRIERPEGGLKVMVSDEETLLEGAEPWEKEDTS